MLDFTQKELEILGLVTIEDRRRVPILIKSYKQNCPDVCLPELTTKLQELCEKRVLEKDFVGVRIIRGLLLPFVIPAINSLGLDCGTEFDEQYDMMGKYTAALDFCDVRERIGDIEIASLVSLMSVAMIYRHGNEEHKVLVHGSVGHFW